MSGRERTSEFSEWLRCSASTEYGEAKLLATASDSSMDSESEPYKSKYAARKTLKHLLSNVEDRLAVHDDNSLEYRYMTTSAAVLCFDIAMNEIETEEISSGEDHLDRSRTLLEQVDNADLATSLKVAIDQQQGLLWSNRNEHSQALQCFSDAKQAYDNHQTSENGPPLGVEELFAAATCAPNDPGSGDRNAQFEKLHTLTLYYLAQAYAFAGQADLSAVYCQETLERQLATDQYNPVDWSLNCATLSQFYITKNQYQLARHCLCCASKIMASAQEGSGDEVEDEEDNDAEAMQEKAAKAKADVARCWVKYCIALMAHSHECLLRGEVAENTNTLPKECKHVIFRDLDVSFFEQKVTDATLLCFDDAKQLFLFAKDRVSEAKIFYVLDGYVTDFVEIEQDLSQLYKHLSYFENSFERRCKMHKRRIDMLRAILVELNQQHFLQISRQLTFEIAEIYTAMADLKKALLDESPAKRTPQSILKTNFLILQSIKYYHSFQDSYKHKGHLPQKFEDDSVRGVLLTFFYSARLYSKYLTVDENAKLQYLQKENEAYEFIVRYCENHPAAASEFQEELKISKEMMELFPVKQSQVLAQLKQVSQ